MLQKRNIIFSRISKLRNGNNCPPGVLLPPHYAWNYIGRDPGGPYVFLRFFTLRHYYATIMKQKGAIRICGGGGTDPGDVRRKALQLGNHRLRAWLCADDDPGRDPGINN